MSINQLFFIPLFLLALFSFCFSCYRRLQLVGVGTSEDRFTNPGERVSAMLTYAFGQKRVLARPYGVNHFLLFWAFLLLLVANGTFLLEGLFPKAGLALLPDSVHHGLDLLFDVVSLVALVSVAVACVRRLFFPPSYLGTEYTSARSPEAFLILGMIATLMAAFFLLNGAEIALGHDGGWKPVSSVVATVMGELPVNVVEVVSTVSWWIHALVLLVFMNLLPRSKHMHILTAIPNCYFRSLEGCSTQPREIFEKGNRFGVSDIEQFSWKDLLDSLTCTECGRCQDFCPAYTTGKPLNPRRIVHDIKVNLLENGQAIKDGQPRSIQLIGEKREGTHCEDAIWACTTCGACTSVCPVLIEQMPKIVKMRRHLVQEKAWFPEELLNLFENMEQRGNPWGIAPSDRSKWSAPLGDRLYKPGETEYLFFVGCAGSFDSRSKHVTLALATILDAAGVSWGILGREEQCCGDSLRRLGNEYVFDTMAKDNVALFKEKGVTKIVTQCPHCFTTLKNDYRQYGLEVEVLHHAQLINRLTDAGVLRLGKNSTHGKIMFHDSCYLGRHNEVYDAPRNVLRKAIGSSPTEFSRSHDASFCCGAGGGRMWMEEHLGTRINLERVKEAMKERPETICVSCPYCMTMMEDGLKDEGAEGVRVRDVAEVVAEALV